MFENKTHKITESKKERRENPRATSNARRTSWIKKRLIAPIKGDTIQRSKRVEPIIVLCGAIVQETIPHRE